MGKTEQTDNISFPIIRKIECPHCQAPIRKLIFYADGMAECLLCGDYFKVEKENN